MPAPTPAPAEIGQIVDALSRNRWGQAVQIAERLFATGYRHPVLYRARAAARMTEGKPGEALVELERGRELAPDDAAVLNDLSRVLLSLGRPRDAMVVLDPVIAQDPSDIASRYNRGLAAVAAGAMTVAREEFETASRLAPDHLDAQAQLARLAAHRGDWAAAQGFGQKILRNQPGHATANRAVIEGFMGEGAWSEAEARLRAWLATPGLGTLTRHHALGLLGDALDGQGRAAEAFAAYEASNAVLRPLYARHYQGAANVVAHLRDLAEAVNAMPAATPTAPAPSPDSLAASHVFLVGFMRSGTTLLEQALANHPDLVTLEEYEALAEPTRAYLSRPPRFQALSAMDATTAERYRDLYWREVRSTGIVPDGKVFLDKHPFNAVKLPLIRALFPHARIIFALRDPRDVVLSCFRHRLRINGFTYEMLDLVGTARLYDTYMNLMERYAAKLPGSIIYHRHEQLAADFDAAVGPLCAAIGLSWRDELRDIGARVREGLTISQSAAQISRGLNKDGVAHWRRYEAQLAPAMPHLERWIRRFGYDAG